jgi:hypothetical protein
MVWSFFCNNPREATKASVFLYPEDEEMAKITELFPSLTNVNEPSQKVGDDNTVISEESLFDDTITPEPEVSVSEDSKMADINVLFPHLANVHQPSKYLVEDDVSISAESLFVTPESQPEISAPVVVPVSAVPIRRVTEDNIDQIIYACRLADVAATQEPEEEPITPAERPIVSKEEFLAVLHRLEKENAWHKQRQVKKTKAVGKKKSRRNNTPKNQGLQQRPANQEFVIPTRSPLTSRN